MKALSTSSTTRMVLISYCLALASSFQPAFVPTSRRRTQIRSTVSPENAAIKHTPSTILPPSSITQSPPSKGIIVVDPFFHGEYMVDRAAHDYGVGVVRVLSPYMARGLNEKNSGEISDDDDDDGPPPLDHLTLTAPLSDDGIASWLGSIPFPITAVICESDSGLEYSERLACLIGGNVERGGLLRHNGYNDARRDKYLMNEVCSAAGIPTARQAFCISVEDAVEKAAQFGCDDTGRNGNKVIIKPRRGVASDRVSLCRSLDCVRSASSDILSSTVFGTYEEKHGSILMQEYVEGTEFAIDVVSKGGIHKVAGIWVYERVSTAEDGHDSSPFAYRSSMLVSADDCRYPTSQLIDYVESCLNALDIKWGLSHTEVKLTPEGAVRLMEVNVRQQNDNIWGMCSACVGYDALSLCLSAYLDDDEGQDQDNLFESIPTRPTLRYSGMVVSLVCYAEGTVKRINHVNEIEGMESFVGMEIYPGHQVGSTVQRSKDIRTDGGWIHLIHEDEKIMIRDYNRICNLMYSMFEVEKEEPVDAEERARSREVEMEAERVFQ